METTGKFEHINRLDVEMHRRGITRSRSEANDLIERKKVTLNGKIATKASTKVSSDDLIRVISPLGFVSRAGEKLAHALEAFKIDVKGIEVIDIGSSTGGFTDCLLKAGAKRVIAIDVGTGQISKELHNDPRVEIHESTDVRRFSLASPVDLAVVDVSFISVSLVLSKVFEFLKPDGRAIILIKPQFEVGMEIAKKFKGVITNEKLQRECVERIKEAAQENDLKFVSETPSPIEGEKGNREFLLCFKKG